MNLDARTFSFRCSIHLATCSLNTEPDKRTSRDFIASNELLRDVRNDRKSAWNTVEDF